MRGVVKRTRLQIGDMFVLEGDMFTIIRGRLQKSEKLSAPILELHDAGQRCVLADGMVIYPDRGVYIERPDALPAIAPTDGPLAGEEFEL